MSQVLVSSLENNIVPSLRSEETAPWAQRMRPLVSSFLGALKGGRDEVIALVRSGRIDGVARGKSDVELILHYAALELVTATLKDPTPKSESLDLDRKTQWENLIAILLVEAGGNVAKATKTPAFQKACDSAVRTLEHVHSLEHVLQGVPPPGRGTPARRFVQTLINTLEGQVATAALGNAAEAAVPELERGNLKEFGRILCGWFAVGSKAAARFLDHELSTSVGFTAIDREIVLYFATKELIDRSVGVVGGGGSSGRVAASWSALFGLVAACGGQTKDVVDDTHTPMARAIEESIREGRDLALIEKLIPQLASDRHRVYLQHLLGAARDSFNRRMAA